MTTIGTVESLWRYPIKSMSGEVMTEAFMGFSGFYGDRCFAFKNSTARKGFPYLNATVQQQMLRYRPQFRYAERAAKPPNLTEAVSIAPGVTPANAEPNDLIFDVVTPSGAVVAVDDPALIEMLGEGLRGENHLTLVRSDRALTDCRPVSKETETRMISCGSLSIRPQADSVQEAPAADGAIACFLSNLVPSARMLFARSRSSALGAKLNGELT